MKNAALRKSFCIVALATISCAPGQAAESDGALVAFVQTPTRCEQFTGGEASAGDALDASYGAALNAGLSSALGGNSRDVEAALATIAKTFAAAGAASVAAK